MVPDLPQEIVRKIFRYNIPRNMDTYDVEIAKLYNIVPCIQGTLSFLQPLSTELQRWRMAYSIYYPELSFNESDLF